MRTKNYIRCWRLNQLALSVPCIQHILRHFPNLDIDFQLNFCLQCKKGVMFSFWFQQHDLHIKNFFNQHPFAICHLNEMQAFMWISIDSQFLSQYLRHNIHRITQYIHKFKNKKLNRCVENQSSDCNTRSSFKNYLNL